MVGSAERSAALLFPLTADTGSSATSTPPDKILLTTFCCPCQLGTKIYLSGDTLKMKQEAQLMLTNPHDVLKESLVKVAKHSTIPNVRYFSSCALITLSLSRAGFSHIRLRKMS